MVLLTSYVVNNAWIHLQRQDYVYSCEQNYPHTVYVVVLFCVSYSLCPVAKLKLTSVCSYLHRELGLLRQRSRSSNGAKKSLVSSKFDYWKLYCMLYTVYTEIILRTLSFCRYEISAHLWFISVFFHRSNIFLPDCDWFWVYLLEREEQLHSGD